MNPEAWVANRVVERFPAALAAEPQAVGRVTLPR
jgi:hypothetical protein